MSNECPTCKGKLVVSEYDKTLSEQVKWFAWKTDKVIIEKAGKNINGMKTIKAEEV